MILNDPRRSTELFADPVNWGREAREMPFELGMVFSLHLLVAIIGFFQFRLGFMIADMRPQPDPVTEPGMANMAQIFEQFMAILAASPFMAVAFSFTQSFLGAIIVWQVFIRIGREIDFLTGQSVYLRFTLVRVVVMLGMTALAWLAWQAAPALGSIMDMFVLAAAIGLIWFQLKIMQGAYEIDSILKVIGGYVVFFLIALFAASFLSMLVTIILM